MPSIHPKYEDDVPKDHCRVRCCNAEGQEFAGQAVPFSYAHPTSKVKGIVQRKPAFSHNKDFTYNLLKPVFQGLGGNCDYERLSENTQKAWCAELDRCDMETIDYNNCENYVMNLLQLCNLITWECTGRDFAEWGIFDEANQELGRAWVHFVRLVWMRDLEWEDLVRYLSDPNREWSVNEEYFLPDPENSVRSIVSNKLMVPLQVWSFMMQHAIANDPNANKN